MSEGLERLLRRVAGSRVGLVTNPTGWLGADGHLLDLLARRAKLVALFAPEHGVRGDLQAGEHVPGGVDPATGVPVYSLHGELTEPPAEVLGELDCLVGCLQDAGSRAYTYQLALSRCLRACGRVDKPLVLLERPTPLGGAICQGNVAGGTFFPSPLPMRPGLTMGEKLAWFNVEQQVEAELEVFPLCDGPRELWYDQLPLPWVAPSPNLPTLTSALCFAATVVLEGTNASEGRGATRPFELLGAPWVDSERLAQDLNRRRLPGLLARPASFCPTFSKHAGAICGGVQLHVTDRLQFDPPRVGVHVLDALRRVAPEDFAWQAGSLDARYHTPAVREALEAGAAPDDVWASWSPEVASFQRQVAELGLGPGWWRAG